MLGTLGPNSRVERLQGHRNWCDFSYSGRNVGMFILCIRALPTQLIGPSLCWAIVLSWVGFEGPVYNFAACMSTLSYSWALDISTWRSLRTLTNKFNCDGRLLNVFPEVWLQFRSESTSLLWTRSWWCRTSPVSVTAIGRQQHVADSTVEFPWVIRQPGAINLSWPPGNCWSFNEVASLQPLKRYKVFIRTQRQTFQPVHLSECLLRTPSRETGGRIEESASSTLGEIGVGLGCAGSIDPAVRDIYPKSSLKKDPSPAAAVTWIADVSSLLISR